MPTEKQTHHPKTNNTMKIDQILNMTVGAFLVALLAPTCGNAATSAVTETEVIPPAGDKKKPGRPAKAAPAPAPADDDDLLGGSTDDDDDLLGGTPAKKPEPEPEPETPAEIVELQRLAGVAASKGNKPKIVEVLGKVGAKRISEVPADKIKAVMKAFKTLAGE